MEWKTLPTPSGAVNTQELVFDVFRGPTPNGQMSAYARRVGPVYGGLPVRQGYAVRSRPMLGAPTDFTKLSTPRLDHFIKL